MMKAQKLQELRDRINGLQKRAVSHSHPVLPFGVEAMDAHLPHKGLELGSLHEFSSGDDRMHDGGAMLFVAGILARMDGPVLWCVRHHDLFAPGLSTVGLNANRLLYVEARDEKSILLVMEEALRHGGLTGVVGEVGSLSLTAARRLHLAARDTATTAFVLFRTAHIKKQNGHEPTSAGTRWRINSLPSSPLPVEGIGRSRWHIELTRCRDGEPAAWEMEACDAQGYLTLPAELAYRPAEKTVSRFSA